MLELLWLKALQDRMIFSFNIFCTCFQWLWKVHHELETSCMPMCSSWKRVFSPQLPSGGKLRPSDGDPLVTGKSLSPPSNNAADGQPSSHLSTQNSFLLLGPLPNWDFRTALFTALQTLLAVLQAPTPLVDSCGKRGPAPGHSQGSQHQNLQACSLTSSLSPHAWSYLSQKLPQTSDRSHRGTTEAGKESEATSNVAEGLSLIARSSFLRIISWAMFHATHVGLVVTYFSSLVV